MNECKEKDCDHKHHKNQLGVSVTATVKDLFTKEQLESFTNESTRLMSQGQPTVDGVKNVAGTHYYETEHGKIGTFFLWVKKMGMPRMYVGTESEIKDMQEDFLKLAKESGVVRKNPRERAEERRKKRRLEKRASK